MVALQARFDPIAQRAVRDRVESINSVHVRKTKNKDSR